MLRTINFLKFNLFLIPPPSPCFWHQIKNPIGLAFYLFNFAFDRFCSIDCWFYDGSCLWLKIASETAEHSVGTQLIRVSETWCNNVCARRLRQWQQWFLRPSINPLNACRLALLFYHGTCVHCVRTIQTYRGHILIPLSFANPQWTWPLLAALDLWTCKI